MRSSSISMVFCCPVAGLAKHNFMLRRGRRRRGGQRSKARRGRWWSPGSARPRSGPHSRVQPVLVSAVLIHPCPGAPCVRACGCRRRPQVLRPRCRASVGSRARAGGAWRGAGRCAGREARAGIRSSRGRRSGRGEASGEAGGGCGCIVSDYNSRCIHFLYSVKTLPRSLSLARWNSLRVQVPRLKASCSHCGTV